MLLNHCDGVLASLIKDRQETLGVKVRTPLICCASELSQPSKIVLRHTTLNNILIELVFSKWTNHRDVGDLTFRIHFIEIILWKNWDDRALHIHTEPTRQRRMTKHNLVLGHPTAHENHGD